jgi:DNA-3-methyladenine glycosylase I
MSSYCDIAPGHPLHGLYHDTEYGFPLTDEAALLERLSLEIFQAGLSWLIILKKRPTIVAAFDGFDAERVAAYGERDRERLLADADIIRNRRKVDAIIENARRVVDLRASDGGIASWIDSMHPLSKDEWVKAFRLTFVFMGGEVVGEFLMSVGYLPGAHREDCPTYAKIAPLRPPWMG